MNLKRLHIYYLIIILSLFVTISCKKSELSALNGTFTVSKAGGGTWTTTYVNTPIPTQNGNFSLQYNKRTSSEIYMFFVLIDNQNDCGLDITTSGPVVPGKIYSQASFYGSFSNVSVNVNRTEVVFTNASYPGKISGTFKAYNASGAVTYSGEFNFIVK